MLLYVFSFKLRKKVNIFWFDIDRFVDNDVENNCEENNLDRLGVYSYIFIIFNIMDNRCVGG